MEAALSVAQVESTEARNDLIRGIVLNSVTREPVSRALVSFQDDSIATLTDSDGRFQLPGIVDSPTETNVSRDPIWLVVKKPGFLANPSMGSLVQAHPGTEISIYLIPEASIKGRVSVSSGDTLWGIGVQLFVEQIEDGIPHWVPTAQTRTDSRGEFLFVDLIPGLYRVVTRQAMDDIPHESAFESPHSAFTPVSLPSSDDAVSGFRLAAGQFYEVECTLVREPFYPIRIPVSSQYASHDVFVEVSRKGYQSLKYSLTYNSAKQRIEGMLPNGVYVVKAITTGPNAATGISNIRVSGTAVAAAEIKLIRDANIHLQITSEFEQMNGDSKRDAKPRPLQTYLQAHLEPVQEFLPVANTYLPQPVVSGDSSLTMVGVQPGAYWLSFTSSRGYVSTASAGDVDLLRQPLLVSDHTDTINVTLRDDGAEINGKIVQAQFSQAGNESNNSDLADRSLTGYVYCIPLPERAGQFTSFLVGPDGHFHAEMMPPGTYRVVAFRSPQIGIPYRDEDAMRVFEGEGEIVHLDANQKIGIEVSFSSLN